MRKAFVLLVCLFSSCKKEVLPSNNLMLMTCKFDGENFRSQNLSGSYYNGGLYSPVVSLCANSLGQNINFRFVGNVFTTGSHALSKLSPTDLAGIEGSCSDIRDLVDPDFFIPNRSISGQITIAKIDTGMVGFNHSVFINLEAYFYFDSDTIRGKWKHMEEGRISYHVN